MYFGPSAFKLWMADFSMSCTPGLEKSEINYLGWTVLAKGQDSSRSVFCHVSEFCPFSPPTWSIRFRIWGNFLQRLHIHREFDGIGRRLGPQIIEARLQSQLPAMEVHGGKLGSAGIHHVDIPEKNTHLLKNWRNIWDHQFLTNQSGTGWHWYHESVI